jgi:hypothetical protein
MSYSSKILCRLNDIIEELQIPKRDTELTCVEENENLYILQFSNEDQTYHVYDFNWNDVTGTVTPMRCDAPEKYDIVYAGNFCDWWTDLSRYDIVQSSDQTILGSYFTNNSGTITTPSDPQKWSCSELSVITISAIALWDWNNYTLPSNVVSFAISAQSWNFDISFDWGSTYILTARDGVREYGDGKSIIDNSDEINVLSHGDVDILIETI